MAETSRKDFHPKLPSKLLATILIVSIAECVSILKINSVMLIQTFPIVFPGRSTTRIEHRCDEPILRKEETRTETRGLAEIFEQSDIAP